MNGLLDIGRTSSKQEKKELRETLMRWVAENKDIPQSDIHPIHIAVLKLDGDDVVFLVKEAGIDVNSLDKQKRTPILYAAEAGKVSMVETLVEKCGADVRVADGRGMTPLHHMPIDGITRMLLDAGADADAKDCNGNTPLHNAECGESVRLLVAAGADPTRKNIRGNTPLHEAVKIGHADVIEALLDAGADIDAKNHKGQTALSFAVTHSITEAVDVLCARGADMETEAHVPVETIRGLGLLYDAVSMRNERQEMMDTINVLFKHGLDPRGKDKDGDAPSEVIRAMGFTGIADRIDARCQELDAKDHAASMMERARTKGMQGSRGREMTL